MLLQDYTALCSYPSKAMTAADQGLVHDMMAYDEQFMDYAVPLSKGTMCTSSADLGCKDEIDHEILMEMASQMADSKC